MYNQYCSNQDISEHTFKNLCKNRAFEELHSVCFFFFF